MNEWISLEAVYRTAPAKPGLLMILEKNHESQSSSLTTATASTALEMSLYTAQGKQLIGTNVTIICS